MPRTRRSGSDLVVVGGGAGGLACAIVAAGIGARVTLVERDRLGGECLWTGCVPSKALLAAADLADRMRHADRVGLAPVAPVVDLGRVMAHVRETQRIIAPQDSAERLRRDGVTVLHGDARLAGPGLVSVDVRRLRARAIVLATGSRPALPAIPGLDHGAVLTTDSVWSLTELPARLLVLGGGAVGCELAQGFARLGAAVTLVERAPRLLGREEPRASALIERRLAADGVEVRCGAQVSRVEMGADGDARAGARGAAGAGSAAGTAGGAEAAGGAQGDGSGRLVLRGEAEPIEFDRLLVATGRRANTEDLGLAEHGVRTDPDGHVVCDARLRSSVERIYAVGDVTGAGAFTHLAVRQARTATVNALFGARGRIDPRLVPRVAFTDPELAAVGLTEARARERWPAATVTSADYAELDRAVVDGRAEGFATLVGDPRGRLVGATVAAPGAGESIAELTAWLSTGARIDRISETVHAYPTLSEGPARAADAHVQARYAAPRIRRPAALLLRALGLVDRPR